MPIKFNCGKCQKAFTVADSSAGKQGRCKDCGNLNTIPELSVAAPSSTQATSKTPATYEVTSAVNGSVFGPADQKTLKQWVKEDRITPDCQIKQVGTQKWITAADAFPSLRKVHPHEAQSVDASNGARDQSFDKFRAGQASEAMAVGGAAASTKVNPFASGSHSKMAFDQTGDFAPTSGEIGFILSHAFKQYKERFGTVLGGFLLTMVAGMVLLVAFYAVIAFMVFAAIPAGGGGPAPPQIGVVTGLIIFVFYILILLANTYFSSGLVALLLKVGRGEPAQATDVFASDNRFLQVLGYGFVASLLIFGLLMLFGVIVGVLQGAMGGQGGGVIEGVMGILILLFVAFAVLLTWPGVYLIIDRKAGVMGAFSLGYSVAIKNIWQFIVIALVASLVYLAGGLLFGIGILLTLPLAMLIIACAYLNMTGQIGE